MALVLAQPLTGQQTTAAAAQTPAAPPAQPVWQSTTVPAQAGKHTAKGKSKKVEYSGPTDIVVLPPTPMLDEEGRQRLDPDGKPMFNLPLKQQRNKHGHPLFDDKGKPVFQTTTELGYDEHGKKIKEEKVKPPKATPMTISRGTFTVDGVVGKAALNYDIADLKYLYLYVPGMGVAVVSNEPFPGAKEQKAAFSDSMLRVTVGEHVLELSSDERLLGKKPESAYVRIDRDFMLPSKFPAVGYGALRVAPYTWPGAKPNAVLAGTVAPPPLPVNLLPVQLLQPCPKGQMRKVAKALPGQTAVPQPCVPIAAKSVEDTETPGPQQNLGR